MQTDSQTLSSAQDIDAGVTESAQPVVVIYSTPTCHFCHMAKEYFKEKGVVYTEYDVAADATKRKEMMEKSGQLGVPVITIGDDVVVGYNKPVIDKLLGL